MKIALATYDKQKTFDQGSTNDEDADLMAFLTDKGLKVSSPIWNDKTVDWGNFDAVIIKSTWDYHTHLADFLYWLEQTENLGVRVYNPTNTIGWNSNKKYLKDVRQNELSVITTEYLEAGSSFDSHFFDMFDTDQLVVKPCVSAGAQNTLTVDKTTFHARKAEIESLLAAEDYIVQPFVNEIKVGEWSFLFFNSQYSHCVLKTPKQGDFRVQHHHGGTIEYPEPEALHVKQAEAYLKAVQQPTLYARVDGVIINGSFVLMELELIEPYLFLNGDRQRLENYYQALMAISGH